MFKATDDRGRDIRAANRAYLRSRKANHALTVAADASVAAIDDCLRELDLLEIRELFAMHAEGR